MRPSARRMATKKGQAQDYDRKTMTFLTQLNSGTRKTLRLMLLGALIVLPAACDSGPHEQPRVKDIEAEAGQTFRLPSTLRFTIEGGQSDVQLRYVFSSMAIETRLYYADGTVVKPGDGIAIPAGEKVAFGEKGGPRVELLGVNRVARGLDEIELNFVFSNGTEQYATAPFVTPEGAESL